MNRNRNLAIARSRSGKALMTVDEAVEADRRYLDEHPDQDEYIREFCPSEFIYLRNARAGD
jgi:hypothetical protein